MGYLKEKASVSSTEIQLLETPLNEDERRVEMWAKVKQAIDNSDVLFKTNWVKRELQCSNAVIKYNENCW